jgi:hypothetical protein
MKPFVINEGYDNKDDRGTDSMNNQGDLHGCDVSADSDDSTAKTPPHKGMGQKD